MRKQAIRCSSLFDPNTATVQTDVVILIEEDKVMAVTKAEEADTTGYEVVDLRGKFVTPGLIDAHVHLSDNGEAQTFGDRPYITLGTQALRCLTHAQADLMAGFTALRDCGVAGFVDVAVRDAINSGMFPGPRLMVSGLPLSSTGGHADTHYSPHLKENGILSGLTCDGVDEMRKGVRYNIKHGVDFIKFMATGGVLSPGTTVDSQQMSFAEMQAICETAKMYGMTTAVHCHGTSGIKDAVRAGVTSVEHGMLMDEEGVALMKGHGTTLVPTLIAAERIISVGKENGTPAWAVAKAEEVFAKATGVFQRCLAEGVKIAFGTDCATPFNYHGAQALEFALMCKYGMAPAQALTAATKTAAELMGKYSEIGSVEVGKYADIAAFDGNPLEDITCMASCCFVMKGGTEYKGVPQ